MNGTRCTRDIRISSIDYATDWLNVSIPPLHEKNIMATIEHICLDVWQVAPYSQNVSVCVNGKSRACPGTKIHHCVHAVLRRRVIVRHFSFILIDWETYDDTNECYEYVIILRCKLNRVASYHNNVYNVKQRLSIILRLRLIWIFYGLRFKAWASRLKISL